MKIGLKNGAHNAHEKKVKKSDKVIIEEEPGGGVYEPEESKPKKSDTPYGRGAVIHKR